MKKRLKGMVPLLLTFAISENAIASAALYEGDCSRATKVLAQYDIHKLMSHNRYFGTRYRNFLSDAQIKIVEKDPNAKIKEPACPAVEILELVLDHRTHVGSDGKGEEMVSFPYVGLRQLVIEADRPKCLEALKQDTYAAKPGEKLIANSDKPLVSLDLAKYAGKMLVQGEYRFWYEKTETKNGACSISLSFVNFEYMWGGHSRNFGSAVLIGEAGKANEDDETGRWVVEEFSLGLSDGTLVANPSD